MSSFLEVDGLYDPSKRFAFTNITAEEFTSFWGGAPIKVKSGETIELPHHLAVKMTTELVDSIMIGNIKLEEVNSGKENYRSPKGSSLGVPSARKEWEDKILRELQPSEESPQLQVIRAQIKAELEADLSKEKGVATEPVPSKVEEFAQITERKRGRPAKE